MTGWDMHRFVADGKEGWTVPCCSCGWRYVVSVTTAEYAKTVWRIEHLERVVLDALVRDGGPQLLGEALSGSPDTKEDER